MSLLYSSPSAELAAELNEVRSDASALVDVFKQVNAPLPDDFPKGALLDVANALRELPDGTARGCLRPLIESQAQLALVRSQHIVHDDNAGVDLSDSTPLFRGALIDQRLRGLMSSVSTALQTANRLSAEEAEPESPESTIEPSDDVTRKSLIEQSIDAQKELQYERGEFDAVRSHTSERADTLRRRLTDALVLNWIGRGELRMPRVGTARLRRIAGALREYPTLLEQSARLVTKGADVADYVYDKWHSLKERMFKAGTQTIREIADDIANFSKKLETRHRDGYLLVQEPKPPPEFNLHRATALIHSGKPPPESWRPFIEYLPLGNRKLGTLAPLEGLTNLRTLTKVKVRVYDLSALSGLTSLESVNLDHTQVRDLGPLSGLAALKYLSLDGTSVDELAPLSGLKSLQVLSLNRTRVSDLRPLSTLPVLRTLYLDGSRVRDIDPLSGLRTLQELHLMDTQVSNLEALRHLGLLRALYLNRAPVKDLHPLARLTSLEILWLMRTSVSDLGPLRRLLSLESLDLQGTQVKNVEPLAGLSSLGWLDLSETPTTKVDALSDLPNLYTLRLDKTAVTNLEPLGALPSLRLISILETRVREIPPSLLRPALRIFRSK